MKKKHINIGIAALSMLSSVAFTASVAQYGWQSATKNDMPFLIWGWALGYIYLIINMNKLGK